ncbi:MAG TPA: STAS domain-containing protein [Rhodocyclaceae bacterium]|nr:STAS domain-containing protein [Rhodocyclaceae bacterium]
MVFSIFKKPPEKMPERPAAKPKSPATPAAGTPAPASEPPKKKEAGPSGFGDSGFGDDFSSSSMLAIHVEHDVDPVQVDIEQAAVLFANSQDSAARAVLETAARAHTGADAERLWRMLLDLLQVLGDRPAFEKLGMEFAQVCEQSPPTWREGDAAAPKTAGGGSQATVMLQGVIAGSDSPGFAKLREALDKKQPMQVNLGKLASLDDFAAGVLCEMFRKARKQGLAITLEGADGCIERLEGRLVAGKQDYEKGWLLLLELYQLLGAQERFDEKAVDYAVTFEVSPPSWETLKAGAVKAVKLDLEPVEEVYNMSGECKNQRFDDLQGFLELHDHPVIDCSRLKRLDFASAGMLQNILRPWHQQGKEIIIRHPHHLVAELLNIVGVSPLARVVVTKF